MIEVLCEWGNTSELEVLYIVIRSDGKGRRKGRGEWLTERLGACVREGIGSECEHSLLASRWKADMCMWH